jgi:SAM-dependent methyltransferase
MNRTIARGVAPPGYYADHYGDRDWCWYQHILATVVRESKPGRILDAGAGHGLFAECARRWGFDCNAIDASAEAIELARLRGVTVMPAALGVRLPFENDVFATVVLNQVIEHLEPRVAQQCLGEIYRVLEPGGMAYVASPSRFDAVQVTADPTHINLLTPSELQTMLRKAGFERLKRFDAPRYKGQIGRRLHRRFRWDRLSETANSMAFKAQAQHS